MKKNIITLLLMVLCVFGLVSCGGKDDKPTKTTPSVTTPEATTPSVTTPSVTTPSPTTPSENPGAFPVADKDGFTTIEEIVRYANSLTATSDKDVDIEVTGTPNFTVPAGGYDGSEVTLKFYHTMGANLKEVLDAYIEEFNVLYPNIHIENEQVGNYDDVRNQISTEITVNEQPNIAYCYPDHVALYNLAKKVITLDSLIDSTVEVQRADGTTEILGLNQEQKDAFIESYYNEGRQFGDGLMYTMPFSKSTEVLYYNKTFFEEHKIEVPTHWFASNANDTTSLEYVMMQIMTIDPTSIPLGYDSEANWFITMAEQCGAPYTSATGERFLFDNVINRTLVKKFKTWYNYMFFTTQELNGAYTSSLFTATEGIRSYMSIGSSAGATHQRPTAVDGKYPFEVGITSIPQMNPNRPKVISQGPSVCIFEKSNPQEVIASWLFVKFLTTSVEFQAEFSMASGYVPVLSTVMENEVYANFISQADGGDHIAALSAKVCLEQEHAYYTSPAFNGSSTARDQVGGLMAAVFGSMTTEDSAINKLIKDEFAKALYECEYNS